MPRTEDNSHAGQGPVLLDIGGEIGALILTMPAQMLGVEIEIRPIRPGANHDHGQHEHGGHGHLVHAAVVNRPMNGASVPTVVFPNLRDGEYELYERPNGQTRLRAHVVGGQVASQTWPG